MDHLLAQIGDNIGTLLFITLFFGGGAIAAVVNRFTNQRIASTKAENKRLKAEVKYLKKMINGIKPGESASDIKDRLHALEDIVTHEDYELNKKLAKLEERGDEG